MAGVILLPGPLVEKGLCRRNSNPGTFEVPVKGVEVTRADGYRNYVGPQVQSGSLRLHNPSFRGHIRLFCYGLCQNSERKSSENEVSPNSTIYLFSVSTIIFGKCRHNM